MSTHTQQKAPVQWGTPWATAEQARSRTPNARVTPVRAQTPRSNPHAHTHLCEHGHSLLTLSLHGSAGDRRRSLVGYSPWGHKESDTTERLHLTLQVIGDAVVISGAQQRDGHTYSDLPRCAQGCEGGTAEAARPPAPRAEQVTRGPGQGVQFSHTELSAWPDRWQHGG